MLRPRTRLLQSRARGQSLVEFALVSIFLILLLTGIIEMGRLFFAFSVVSNAAQEGSRYAITRPRDLISQSGAATRIALGTAVPTQLVVPDGTCNIFDNARQEVWGIPRTDVRIDVSYENESGTPVVVNNNPSSSNYYGNVIRQGNRVVVEASYKFDFFVPLIGNFAPDGIDVKMSSARSILNNGDSPFNCAVNYEPAPAPPTATNSPTRTGTATRTVAPTNTPVGTATSTNTSTTVPTSTRTRTATATATGTPTNQLKFASIDVYKAVSNNFVNDPLDVVAYVVDQNGQYVPDALVLISAVSSGGQTGSGALPSEGGGRYEECGWGRFSGQAGSVTVSLRAIKSGYQDAVGTATNKMGSYCNTPPTSTSTPTLVPSNTPTSNPSITNTPTLSPTNTYTPTPPPTFTPSATPTATPVACPYTASVSAYKASGNQRAYVSINVKNSTGRNVAGAPVSAVIRGEVRRGTTDSAGNACLVFNKYLGTSVSGSVSVSGPECSIYNQPFTTTSSGNACQ